MNQLTRQLACWSLLTLVWIAKAEEQPNQLLTALTSTTISGSIQSSITRGMTNDQLRTGAYIGPLLRFGPKDIVLGVGAVSNTVVSCAVGLAPHGHIDMGATSVVMGPAFIRTSGVIRGRIEDTGYFRGRIRNGGEETRGYFVFSKTQWNRSVTRRFVLQHQPPPVIPEVPPVTFPQPGL